MTTISSLQTPPPTAAAAHACAPAVSSMDIPASPNPASQIKTVKHPDFCLKDDYKAPMYSFEAKDAITAKLFIDQLNLEHGSHCLWTNPVTPCHPRKQDQTRIPLPQWTGAVTILVYPLVLTPSNATIVLMIPSGKAQLGNVLWIFSLTSPSADLAPKAHIFDADVIVNSLNGLVYESGEYFFYNKVRITTELPLHSCTYQGLVSLHQNGLMMTLRTRWRKGDKAIWNSDEDANPDPDPDSGSDSDDELDLETYEQQQFVKISQSASSASGSPPDLRYLKAAMEKAARRPCLQQVLPVRLLAGAQLGKSVEMWQASVRRDQNAELFLAREATAAREEGIRRRMALIEQRKAAFRNFAHQTAIPQILRDPLTWESALEEIAGTERYDDEEDVAVRSDIMVVKMLSFEDNQMAPPPPATPLLQQLPSSGLNQLPNPVFRLKEEQVPLPNGYDLKPKQSGFGSPPSIHQMMDSQAEATDEHSLPLGPSLKGQDQEMRDV